MDDLSIVSASIDSPEWAKLLIKSIWRYTHDVNYEIIIIDNGSLDVNLKWLRRQANDGRIRLLEQDGNLGHGFAMDIGTKVASHPFVCFLDIDCHLLREGWASDFFELYRNDPKVRMIGKRGPDHKPFHPPFFFYERDFILDNDISFKHIPGVSTDTAQKSYWDILELGYKSLRLEGRPREFKRLYPGLKGQELNLCGKTTFYHHWRGTRYNENNPSKQKKVLDGVPIEEYLEEKRKLFEMDGVRKILI